ncbi:MAG: hypothetical protein DPW09_10260 [Anaerolineae bacterium]|nr:hypothetical protein [Anaerolineales bacterium]MCQ3973816.1 hypothetical protein [Anaerolineae bacterium]
MQRGYLKRVYLNCIVLLLLIIVTGAVAQADGPEPVLVKDIYPGYTSSVPYNLTNVNGMLFFATSDPVKGYRLWKSNGTANGTVEVKHIPLNNYTFASGFPREMTNVNGTLFFTTDDGVHGVELWKSNGTAAGTVMVKDVRPGSLSSGPYNLTNVNGTLFFIAYDGVHGNELWKSDGTATGTVMVKDIYTSIYRYSPFLTNVNGTLFFAIDDGIHGNELWKSDGTATGTVMVKDIFPITYPSPGGSLPFNLTNVNGTLFFLANDGVHSHELWKSNGTAAGTVMVKDILPGNNGQNIYNTNLTNVNGTLFFLAYDGIHGYELWKSNGTAAGTVMVKDILPGNPNLNEYPLYLTDVNGTLFFLANDGVHGDELWKSNGTAAGTVMVKDINFYSSPLILTNVNGTLFFSAADTPFNGNELWKSDGTAAGTVMVKDITLGNSLSSYPADLTNVNGTLFFRADDGIHGTELWKLSDGPIAPDNQIPTSPQLITPTLGVNLTTLRPVFDWTNATDNVGVVSYTLTLKDAENRTSKFISTISTYTPRSNLAQSHYTWSVMAHDAAGNSSVPSHPANFAIISQAPLNKKAYLPIVLKK